VFHLRVQALSYKNPCKSKCSGFKPCTLCGKYPIYIKCKCKVKSCGGKCYKD
jgi:hypothetical protein